MLPSYRSFREAAYEIDSQEHLRGQLNWITADGVRFAHPVRHMGKTVRDLPLVGEPTALARWPRCPLIMSAAFDTFENMYQFPNFDDIDTPGVLHDFIADLHARHLLFEYKKKRDRAIELAQRGDKSEKEVLEARARTDGAGLPMPLRTQPVSPRARRAVVRSPDRA